MESTINTAVQRLTEAEETGIVCLPIRDLIGTDDLTSAYAIQDQISNNKIKQGGKIVGRKIGLTSHAIQKQLGVDQPDFGALWADREVENGGFISIKEIMQPKAETEIAFVLGQDLAGKNLSTVDVLNAIDYALVSIEIVGSRIKDWDIKITDTVADNASASHWAIGHQPTPLTKVDLLNCKMSMTKNGAVVSEGVGRNCLGSPINATRWLANKMIQLGQPLKAGDLILSGALGPMVNVQAGDKFDASIEGLGSVSISFTE